MATQNILSAGSLAEIIGQSLPASTSGPQIKNAYDAVAIAIHAAMLAVGFRLIGLSEDDRMPPANSGSTPVLPERWNAQSPAHHSFAYAHTQSSMEYLVKLSRLGSKVVVMGVGIGDDKTISFDVRVNDYTSAGNLPAAPTSTTSESDTRLTPTPSRPESDSGPATTDVPNKLSADVRGAITHIYISAGRLSDLGALVRLNLIQKLLPSLHKEGYEDTPATTARVDNAPHTAPQPGHPSRPGRSDPARPHPLHDDPLRAPPRRPQYPQGDFPPPDFEDEHGILRPPRPFGSGGLAGPSIGHRDLYPAGLGPNDPFGGSIGPGLGGVGGGGMHPTFDDPLFRGQGRGGHGSDPFGYDPQAPPGARYDPVGPGGAPRGSSGGAGMGGFGGAGGRPHNPFGGFGEGDFI